MSKKSKKNAQSRENGNTKLTHEKRQAKKDAVLGTEKKGRLPLVVAMVCSILIIGGGIYYATYDQEDTDPVTASVASENITSQVSLPATLFDDGKARHFEHVAGEFTEFIALQRLDRILHGSAGADIQFDAGPAEDLGRLGAHLAGDQDIGSGVGNHLGGLDASALGRDELGRIVQVDGLACFGIEQDEAGAAAKTGIHIAVEGFSPCAYGNFHDRASLNLMRLCAL